MLRSLFWKPYSHLLIVGDGASWSIDEDAKALKQTADKLSIPTDIVRKVNFNIQQVIHHTSQFSLIDESIYKPNHRISVDYYHGKPEQQESFLKCYEAVKNHHGQISRVRVSTKEMEQLIKSTGIDPLKVTRIPIGVDINIFKPSTPENRNVSRNKLGIPLDAVVIGSFQKDGVGWDEGNEPKLIKGPDVFLRVVEKLKADVPNLWVLLSGPARGYVKKGLEDMNIPYSHQYLKDFKELTHLYDALDLYIISSREEGGPKACLESMAKGVPLVTTQVGQCADIVASGENAMMTAIDDVDGLRNAAFQILRDNSIRENLVKKGLTTARQNSLENQLPLWKEYFKNLITS